ncbi:hypothetical protein IAR50_002250 [Cryptococcus sp. DSM 104548]
MSSDPLRRAQYLHDDAIARNSTSEVRRRYHSALIELPSTGSHKAKRFFGSNISTFFAEFEDLQDRAIDALLDLCEDEDEDMRIVGINGLGPTAKADPRWVKGNTGVLLQLLASQPRELEAVTNALVDLLFVSPVDVFSVMADDCKGSEAETGASRDKILKFLQHEGASALKELLHSGNNRDAEERFMTEFEGVLSGGGLALEGKMAVIDLLVPLSTVSGANARTDSVNSFIKLVTNVIPPMAPISEKPRLNHILKELVDRLHHSHPKNPPYDCRYMLYFLSIHGAGLTLSLFRREGDIRARGLLEGMKEWVVQANVLWTHGQVKDPCLDKMIVAKGIVEQLWSGSSLDGKQLFASDKVDRETSLSFEILFWCFYKLTTKPDFRNVILPSDHHLMFPFRILRDWADTKAHGHPERDIWQKIHQFLLVLTNPTSPLPLEIYPSWQPRHLYPQRPSQPVRSSWDARGQMPPHRPGQTWQQGQGQRQGNGYRPEPRGFTNAPTGAPVTLGSKNGFHPPSGPSAKSRPRPGPQQVQGPPSVPAPRREASTLANAEDGRVNDKDGMNVDAVDVTPAPTQPQVVAETKAVSKPLLPNTTGKRTHEALSQPELTPAFSRPPPTGPKAVLSTASLQAASASTAKASGKNEKMDGAAGRPAKKRKSEVQKEKKEGEKVAAPSGASGAVPALLARMGPRDNASLPPTSAPVAPPLSVLSKNQPEPAPSQPPVGPPKKSLNDRLNYKPSLPSSGSPSIPPEPPALAPEPAPAPQPPKVYSIRGHASDSPLPTPVSTPKPDDIRKPVSILGAGSSSSISIRDAAKNRSDVTSSTAEEESRFMSTAPSPGVVMAEVDEPGTVKKGRGHRKEEDPPAFEQRNFGLGGQNRMVNKDYRQQGRVPRGGYPVGGGFGPARRGRWAP